MAQTNSFTQNGMLSASTLMFLWPLECFSFSLGEMAKLFICSVAVTYHGRAHLKMDIYRLAGDQNCFSNINPRNSRRTH
jgi:hypothetical protein